MDDSLKKLGALVRQKRIERGLTARNVARLTGVPFASLSRFERGERGLLAKNIAKLCSFFGINYDIQVIVEEKKPVVEKEPVTITCRRCLARQTLSL